MFDQKGEITLTGILIGALLLGVATVGGLAAKNSIDEARQVIEEQRQVIDEQTELLQRGGDLNLVETYNRLGAFRPSNYVGKLMTRLVEGGSETTFKTTPNEAADGTTLDNDKLGDFLVFTINPGADNEEKISVSGINATSTDGTVTWNIINRGLSFTENAQVTANIKQHAIGETVIISNDDHYLSTQFPAIDDTLNIPGDWTFTGNPPQASSDPIDNEDLARRSWVLDNLPAGAVSNNAVVVSGNAGGSVATGTIVYFNRYDGEWINADADLASTTRGQLLGVAQGAGTDGNAITNGILLKGDDANNPGGTAGNIIYLSNTAGATSTSAGTVERVIGMMRSSTRFYFDPGLFGATIDVSDSKIPAGIVDLVGYGGQASTTQLNVTEQLYVTGTSTQATTTIDHFTSLQLLDLDNVDSGGVNANATVSTTILQATSSALQTQGIIHSNHWVADTSGNSCGAYYLSYHLNNIEVYATSTASIPTNTRYEFDFEVRSVANVQEIVFKLWEWNVGGSDIGGGALDTTDFPLVDRQEATVTVDQDEPIPFRIEYNRDSGSCTGEDHLGGYVEFKR